MSSYRTLAHRITPMARPKKSIMRQFAKRALEERNYAVEMRTGQGIMPGGRLVASKDGESQEVAVRTSYERILGFNRHTNGLWRTLGSVDLVLAVVPGEKNSKAIQVLAFDATKLKSFFDKA